MNDQPLIDLIVAEISRRLPAELGVLRQEVERNVQAVLRESISRLDLVSREEFDIQQQVLARTRQKLEQLRTEVTTLETRLHDQP